VDIKLLADACEGLACFVELGSYPDIIHSEDTTP